MLGNELLLSMCPPEHLVLLPAGEPLLCKPLVLKMGNLVSNNPESLSAGLVSSKCTALTSPPWGQISSEGLEGSDNATPGDSLEGAGAEFSVLSPTTH